MLMIYFTGVLVTFLLGLLIFKPMDRYTYIWIILLSVICSWYGLVSLIIIEIDDLCSK